MLDSKTAIVALALTFFLGCSGGSGEAGASTPGSALPATAETGSEPGAAAPGTRGCVTQRGECSSEAIATGLKRADALTHAGGTLWIATDDGLTSIRGAERRVFPKAHVRFRVAVLDGAVAWDDGGIYMMPADGSNEPYSIASRDDYDDPELLTIASDDFLFKRGSTIYSFEPGKHGYYGWTSVSADVSAFVVEGKDVYYASGPYSAPSKITIGVSGPSSRKLATIEDARWTTAMALTPSHVIFSVYEDRTVRSVPRTGGETRIIARDQVDLFQMTADDSGVYWASRAGVMWAALDGSESRVLVAVDWDASGKGFVGKVATSDDSVFFTDPGRNAVFRIAK
jgi:hypothetical protein